MTSIEALIPELQQPARDLIQLAGQAGVQPRITSTLRTRSEQERLYKRFQSGLSRYPAAPPGTSAHEFGYAFDVVVIGDENQADLGQVWEAWGGVWGGQRDPVHFEYPGFKATVIARETRVPVEGGVFYVLADFLSGFVPYLGVAQLADFLYRLLGGDETEAEWYLQHPAEAIRDLLKSLAQ